MLTALLLDHVVSSTVVTGFNLSGVKTVYIGGGLADDQEASESQAWCTSRWCVSRRAHPPPKDVSGESARVCPPSTPNLLASAQAPVDVSKHREHPASLYTGRAAAQSER